MPETPHSDLSDFKPSVNPAESRICRILSRKPAYTLWTMSIRIRCTVGASECQIQSILYEYKLKSWKICYFSLLGRPKMAKFRPFSGLFRVKMQNLLLLAPRYPQGSRWLTMRKRRIEVDSNPHTCALVRIFESDAEKFEFSSKNCPQNAHFRQIWPILVIFDI